MANRIDSEVFRGLSLDDDLGHVKLMIELDEIKKLETSKEVK
jgi:hypothetical protein